LAQRFRIDGETFMTILLANFHYIAKFLIIHVRLSFVQVTRNIAVMDCKIS
jgi:hypothetical protein